MSVLAESPPRLTTADRAKVELRREMLVGRLVPGQRLREEALAEDLGFGRGPIREALSRLTERGLVLKQPFAGFSMRELSVADIRDYYRVRAEIELLAVRLCWPLRDRSFRTNLRVLHARLVEAVAAGDPLASVEAEADFHAAVYIASGNQPLLRCWDLLACYRDLYYVSLRMLREDLRAPAPMSASHARLLDLLTGSGLDAALAETRAHLDLGLEQFERAQEEHAEKAGKIHWTQPHVTRR